MHRRAILAAVLAIGIGYISSPILAPTVQADAGVKIDTSWVVTADEARTLIEAGALVLDAREASWLRKSLPGAVDANWINFSKAAAPPEMGLLADDAVLTEKFRALGVSDDRPVVVVGYTHDGWGEDGRIVWTLRSRGHTKAVVVDGGYAALVEGGAPKIEAVPTPGNWTARYVPELEATIDEVKAALGNPNVVFLDTREPREFEGGTPYGESRGGRVPGAKHIYYKDFFTEDGHLLAPDQLRRKLAMLGITPDKEVIAYCTGGVRSGYFTSVLQTMGIKSQNYAGSMWEWAAKPASEYPLEK